MLLSNTNLRRLVVGQFLSAVGDQFYLIAIPWLALEISGQALVAGALLAAAGIPRAVFMLLGGAVTDRYSPKMVLVASNGLQALLMVAFGWAVLNSLTGLWLLFGLSFATGFIDAFGLPAFNAMVPRVTPQRELEGGNIYVQGGNMASLVIGPALAGLLIARGAGWFGMGGSLDGIGIAFLINALTFLLGISFFGRMRPAEARIEPSQEQPLLRSIGAVLEHIRADRQLMTVFGLMAVLGLLLTGSIRVAFPLLAEAGSQGGAQQFGNMTSAFGVGMALGMLAVRALPRPPQAVSGLTALALIAATPVGLIVLAFSPPQALMLAVILLMGCGFGYVFIYVLSWLQRRTPQRLHGRLMAVALFATIGLSPVSQVLMGYLLDLSLQFTLLGVGGLALILLAANAARPEMWSLRE